jgi:hypothetical protein
LLFACGVLVGCQTGIGIGSLDLEHHDLAGSTLDGASGGCTGSAPGCLGQDSTACCAHDPYGAATCVDGTWVCGSAPAPGCDDSSASCTQQQSYDLATSSCAQSCLGGGPGCPTACTPGCGGGQVCCYYVAPAGGDGWECATPASDGTCPGLCAP